MKENFKFRNVYRSLKSFVKLDTIFSEIKFFSIFRFYSSNICKQNLSNILQFYTETL